MIYLFKPNTVLVKRGGEWYCCCVSFWSKAKIAQCKSLGIVSLILITQIEYYTRLGRLRTVLAKHKTWKVARE